MIFLERIIRHINADYRKRAKALEDRGVWAYIFSSSGYVLAVVLIITSILMTITGEFVISARTSIGIINKYKNRVRAIYLAKSGIELAKYVLYSDQKGAASMAMGISSERDVDSYNDLWAFDFPPIPIDEGTLTIKIQDEQAKINLSVLANEFVDKSPYYAIVQNFFINLGFNPDAADGILDWVDIDDTPSAYGAESDYYGSKNPRYSARNEAMESIDDLLLIKGITPEMYYGLGGGNFGKERNLVEHNRGTLYFDTGKLLDMSKKSKELKKESGKEVTHKIGPEVSRRLDNYFRVYGERSNYLDDLNKININTASYRVLSALTADMSDDTVTEMIMRRLIEPFKSINEISDLITDNDTRKNLLTTKSSMFKITSTASFGNATIAISAVYNRDMRKIIYWSEE